MRVLVTRAVARRNKRTDMTDILADTKVTYAVNYEGKVYIFEHVPARVSPETGEQYFPPETVQRIHTLVKSRRKPDKHVETPVYEYPEGCGREVGSGADCPGR